MKTKPKLSILIATVGRRQNHFKKLVTHLLAQADDKPVEIVAYWNNGELPIGEIRQILLEQAHGKYICFVDDDDWVPDYYVDEILANLGEDYVGFQVELTNNGEKKPPVYHSLVHTNWHEAYDGYYRNVTHLNPVRRAIALEGKFNGHVGEDENWVRQIERYVKTENYIDRVMYFYRHNSMDTHFAGVDYTSTPGTYKLPVINHNQFRLLYKEEQ